MQKFCSVALAAILWFCACFSVKAESNYPSVTPYTLFWQQRTGVAKILPYVYELATSYITTQTRNVTIKRAVIVDADETLIDNSAFFNADEGMSWEMWEKVGNAPMTPASIRFLSVMRKHDIAVAIVTNRIYTEKLAQLMQQQGFTPGNGYEFISARKASHAKAQRFIAAEQLLRQRYGDIAIVASIGDNPSDNACVIFQPCVFFELPNALYGNGGRYNPYFLMGKIQP